MRRARPTRVALATSAAYATLAPDDRPLAAALDRRGIEAVPAVWDDAAVAWRDFDAVVVRSCWDYHHRPDRFAAWVSWIERLGVPLWNPPAVLRWNADKRYLRELEARGVRVVPTAWIEPGGETTLAALLRERGWTDAVVKPAVSASAHGTWRTALASADADEARFRAAARERLLVQPFVREVAESGEWSLVFFGGRFSHAVLKRPRAGDFRVQAEHGGEHRLLPADPGLVREAEAVLAAAPPGWLYARVDGCVVGGRLCLMELELLEPMLFLEAEPLAAERFADALVAALVAALD